LKYLNIGEILAVNAKKYPDKIALKDIRTTRTFPEIEIRTNKIANAFLDIGVKKGDKVAVLLNNSIEFMEIYLAAAKMGAVIVPVNFRLVEKEIQYIVNNSDAATFIVQSREPSYINTIDSIRSNLDNIPDDRYIALGTEPHNGYSNFERLVNSTSESTPEVTVENEDTWILLYTSGTTGIPKGVVRSHRSYIAFYMINEIEHSFTHDDYGMILMPLAHVNSTFYSFVFTYIGAGCYVHREYAFNPEEVLALIDKEKITYTSMIPTHYSLIFDLPKETKEKYNMNSMRTLLCSSAPARKALKLQIMEFFPNVRLFEAYGSTEAGLVTILRPEDQLRKLGSIGRECVGTDVIKVLDEAGNEVPVGEVGELYSKGPMMFDEYYKLPDKTEQSFRGEYFTARDMVRCDDEGFYYIVDRKDNMIITGGEHVYPSEVEEVVCQHPAVFDAAIVGVPDKKWGEAVKAVVILKDNSNATEEEIIEFCRGKMAGYKRPKTVDFISRDEMPRTAAGKILHRILRDRFKKEID